ncbi:MAG: hypothetical protein H6740_22695 [Alphaproteobacteria bacterium]|nr:hypothetical protein [Alphaproteobacteria bacterium]
MKRALWLLPLLLGCHAKFKKAAPLIDEVRVQTVLTGSPYVELGWVATGNELVDVAVAVVQEARSVKPAQRIAGAVKVADMRSAVSYGLAEGLGGGPPFSVTDQAQVQPLVEIEIESYGLYVPYLGAPGEFTFTGQARVYDAQGKKVYRQRMSCSVMAGDPSVGEIVFGVVNNVEELNRMSDEDINAAFAATAEYCGARFAQKMRQHAG